MKHEASFYVQDGIIYDASHRQRIFRGYTVHIPPEKPDSPAWLPFSVEEADSFFLLMQRQGITLLRFCIAWNAVEHAGPELYDEEYLAQLRLLLRKAEQYNLFIIIEPVIGLWHTPAAKSCAPAWTLEAAGIDPDKAAARWKEIANATADKIPGNILTSYWNYITSTMYTLFWGGSTFAPQLQVDGLSIQEYLQFRYIEAMKHTARRIKDCKAVIGFGCISGSHPGFIGTPELDKTSPVHTPLLMPAQYQLTPFEWMKAASGMPATCKKTGGKIGGVFQASEYLIPEGTSIFRTRTECPWLQNGVWHQDSNSSAELDKTDYFVQNGGFQQISDQFIKPFHKKYISAFQKKHSHFLFFPEPTVTGLRSLWVTGSPATLEQQETAEKEGGVIAGIDAESVKIIPVYRVPAPTRSSKRQESVTRETAENTGNADYTEQLRQALATAQAERLPVIGIYPVSASVRENGTVLQAVEALCGSLILEEPPGSGFRKKNAPSTTELTENKSESSGDATHECPVQQNSVIFLRPYPAAVNGSAVRQIWVPGHHPVFTFEWNAKPARSNTNSQDATEIFVPAEWYPAGWNVEFTGSGTVVSEPENQRLLIFTEKDERCSIRITEKKPSSENSVTTN